MLGQFINYKCNSTLETFLNGLDTRAYGGRDCVSKRAAGSVGGGVCACVGWGTGRGIGGRV